MIDNEALEQIVQRVIAGLQDCVRRPYLTPPQIAKLLGVKQQKVTAWIEKGELEASNVATSGKRWRVSQDSLDSFLRRRQAVPPVVAKRKRRQTDGDVIAFY
jgi:excisionase family DNA binding protein